MKNKGYFRYFYHLLGLQHIVAIPLLARSWVRLDSGDGCMYPPSMHQRSQWELDNFPWWIEMDDTHMLVCEGELHDATMRGLPSKTSNMTPRASQKKGSAGR